LWQPALEGWFAVGNPWSWWATQTTKRKKPDFRQKHPQS
jgi:hypothetical protein